MELYSVSSICNDAFTDAFHAACCGIFIRLWLKHYHNFITQTAVFPFRVTLPSEV